MVYSMQIVVANFALIVVVVFIDSNPFFFTHTHTGRWLRPYSRSGLVVSR